MTEKRLSYQELEDCLAQAERSAAALRTRVAELEQAEVEHTQVQQKLQESEERFRTLFERSPIGSYRTTSDGRILAANPALVKTLGYASLDKLATRNLRDGDFEPSYSRTEFIERIERDGVILGLEAAWKKRDGSIAFFRENAVAIRDVDGHTQYYEGSVEDISERKRAEETLQESEERYHLLFDRNLAGVYQAKLDGTILDCNESMAAMFGYASRDELLSAHALDLYFESPDRGGFLTRLQEHGILTNSECHLRRKDGTPIDILENVSLLPDEDGELTIIEGMMVDITERKQAEEALRESEERFRQITENSGQVFWLTDWRKRELLYISPSYESVYDRSLQSIWEDRRSWIEAIHPEDRAWIDRIFAEKGDRGEATDEEYRIVRQDGSIRWIHDRSIPIRDEAGEVYRWASVAEDITERKRAEEALRQSERRFRDIAENALEWIWEVDADGRYTYASPVVREILGYKPEEVIGKHFHDFFDPQDREDTKKAAFDAFAVRHPFREFVNRNIHKNGRAVWLSTSGVPMVDECGKLVGYRGADIDITERKRAEEALRESELRYRSVAEDSPGLICRFLPDGEITFVNDAYCRYFGKAANELVGHSFLLLIPEEAHATVMASISALTVDSPIQSHEHPVIAPDGKIRWLRWTNRALFDKQGQIVSLQAFGEDVTERKRAEDERRKLAAVVKHSRELVNISTLEGKMLFLNEAGGRMLGIDPADVEQVNIMEVIPEHLRGLVQSELLPALIEGGAWEGDLQYRNLKTGELADVHAMTFSINDPDTGKPLFFANVSLDITERKQAEAERVRLMSAIEQAAETVVITDAEGTIQYANPAFERITGYSREEALGQNPRILKGNKHNDAFYKEMWDTLTRGETWRGHFTNKRKDGTLFEEDAAISPVHDTTGKIVNYVAVKHDVTKEAALEAQLRHSQKMEAVGQLAAGVAHEFNNLLVGILGNAELLLTETTTELPDAFRQSLEDINTCGERAAALTQQLLTFARKRITKVALLDLNQTVASLDKMIRRLVGQHVKVDMVLDQAPCTVRMDQGELEQVVVNLVINSRDALSANETLTIRMANVTLTEDDLPDHPDLRPGSYVLLEVADTGCGMSEETVGRMFEPFFTTKPTGKGTGLGLSTVFAIVSNADGHIAVDSRLGKGTVFRVYLPRAAGKAAEPLADQAEALETPRANGETILVCDDEELVLRSVCDLLEGRGYSIIAASDGRSALDLAAAHSGTIALLLTDVVMPKMNGRDLARRLTQQHPDMKVIFMSGYAADILDAGEDQEIDVEFIEKPAPASVLFQRVREVLDKGRSVAP